MIFGREGAKRRIIRGFLYRILRKDLLAKCSFYRNRFCVGEAVVSKI